MHARFRALLFLSAVGLATAGQVVTTASDWPAWRGPDRTGVSGETGLLKEWPEGGPKLLWKAKGLGGGYSTPSIVGGKMYILGTTGELKSGKGFGGGGGAALPESLYCLDVKDKGKVLWSTEFGKTTRSFPGPRSSPTVVDGRIYAISSNGILGCFNADKGTLVWKKDLIGEYSGSYGNWNYAESPLVDGDVVVCTPGGSKATMLALNVKDGKEVWKSSITGLKAPERKGKGGFGGKGKGGFGGKGGKSEYNTAGYSSAIKAEVGGTKQYVQFLAGGVVGVDAKSGKLLWHYDEPSCGSANCSTPLFRDGEVFAASGYGNGGGKAKITGSDGKFEAKQKFFVKDLQNHHGNMVLVGDYIYGTGNQALMCVSFKSGEVAWTARGVGKGSVAAADGMIYHRGERGDIALVEATSSGYKEKGRFRQPDRSDQNAWSSPVISGGKLYLRDWGILLCYDISAKK